MCFTSAIFFPQLDLSQPLEDQGPLDVIIHKLTDLILEADQNDSQAVMLVQRVQVCNPLIFLVILMNLVKNKTLVLSCLVDFMS